MRPTLPSQWSTVPLKYVVTLVVSKAVERDVGRPYVGLEQIESGTGRLLTTVGAASGETANLFEEGDVLFGKLRPYLAKVLHASFAGRCTSEALVLRPCGVSAKFLHHLCLSDAFLDLINSSTYGAQMPRASWDFIGNIQVPFPPQDRQCAIAAFLDKKTAANDALIAKKERLIELLQEKRQALITQAVTKGLDPTVPMKDSGVEWIGKIPAHWQVKRIKHVCRLESGHTPSRSEPSYWIEEECVIPWISLNDSKTLSAKDVIDDTAFRISPRGMANSSAHLIEAGAVVFTRDATVGLASVTSKPMAVSQHIIAWVCGPSLANEYLLRVINAMTVELERLTWGATIKTIGMGDVRELTTPLPPTTEQQRIVAYLKATLGRLDAAAGLLRKSVEVLREYRQALITAAVTGKLDISTSTSSAATMPALEGAE